ncbi:MAG: helix-turn-helix domain-containing protein [Candidatus Adiutrix sp.]|jgi:putative transcriptional regulator|nr:helix-turn-helix domain-containing protein [Candidatus Adiutrix sp.]
MTTERFERLKESIKEAVAVSKGEKAPARRIVYTDEEVRAIREGRGSEVKAARLAVRASRAENIKALRTRLELSQSEFARLLQVNVRTLQNWEQGHRRPTGPAEVLLELAAKSPRTILEALHSNGGNAK